MATLTRSAEISTSGTLTVGDMREFLNEVPADAELRVEVLRGDPRDPREAGHRETKIQATWTEGQA
ncbi:hypothetical protein [Glutamicibacter sp. X7]